MKFTLSWLKDHLETDKSVEEIADKLTALGLEIESVTNPAESLAAFTVAEVMEMAPHPDADTLNVCQVKTKDGMKQIICAGKNVRAGIKSPWAAPGCTVPANGMEIKVAKMRGVESHGMLCGSDELCLTGDSGKYIMELPADAEVGAPIADVLGLNDPVFEIGLTPNRPDCAGVYGIARDLAAAGMGTLKPYEVKSLRDGNENCSVSVTIEKETRCLHFAGRTISNIANQDSPAWLKQRLEAINERPISALVDITNYIMFDLGRPLHVYDADKVQGNLTVKTAKGGEEFEALNDKSYACPENAVMICDERPDQNGLIGLGGIVGGVSTSVDENTKNVFVESALFDPISIAATGRALSAVTSARYRFERGVDPESVMPGLLKATDMILELCGGDATQMSTVTKAGQTPDWKRAINFDTALIKKRGGIEIADNEVDTILTSLGFEKSGASYTPPSWRPDVMGPADLVEEVLRIHGYDKVEPVFVHFTEETPDLSPTLKAAAKARRTLSARGLLEAVTWSFMSSKEVAALGDSSDSGDSRDSRDSGAVNDNLILQNPISSELDHLRPSVVPNLLQAAQTNTQNGQPNGAFFEVGPIFSATNGQTAQERVITGVRCGKTPRHWRAESRAVDVYDGKADLMAVLEELGAPAGVLSRDVSALYHPGRAGSLNLGKNRIATFGEIHPAVVKDLKLKKGGPFVAFEIFLDRLPLKAPKGTAKKLLEINPLQPVERDFAFVVDTSVRSDELMRAASQADKKLISDVQIFDVYEGEHLAAGKKSLAISVTFQPAGESLTDAALEGVSKKIIDAVASTVGGELRA